MKIYVEATEIWKKVKRVRLCFAWYCVHVTNLRPWPKEQQFCFQRGLFFCKKKLNKIKFSFRFIFLNNLNNFNDDNDPKT